MESDLAVSAEVLVRVEHNDGMEELAIQDFF